MCLVPFLRKANLSKLTLFSLRNRLWISGFWSDVRGGNCPHACARGGLRSTRYVRRMDVSSIFWKRFNIAWIISIWHTVVLSHPDTYHDVIVHAILAPKSENFRKITLHLARPSSSRLKRCTARHNHASVTWCPSSSSMVISVRFVRVTGIISQNRRLFLMNSKCRSPLSLCWQTWHMHTCVQFWFARW